jgi:hypothetical protein
MNEDLLNQYRQEPSPAFKQELYRRISRPASAQAPGTQRWVRRSRAVAQCAVLLIGTLLLIPAGRTLAQEFLYRIGVFTVTNHTDLPGIQPTAQPPSPSAQSGTQHAPDPASASALAGFPVQAPASLPAGYLPTGDWSIGPQGQGVVVAYGYRNSSGHYLFINEFKYAGSDAYNDMLSPQEQAQPVSIHGQPGVLITGRLVARGTFEEKETSTASGQPALEATTWLYWAEDGVNVTLFSNGLSSEALIEVAESMH